MRAIPTVSHVEVRVSAGVSCGEWVGYILIVGVKVEIVISWELGIGKSIIGW